MSQIYCWSDINGKIQQLYSLKFKNPSNDNIIA